MSVGLLIFSKHRPYQLLQCLKSIHQYLLPAQQGQSNVSIHILVQPGPYTSEYEYIFEQYPSIHVTYESNSPAESSHFASDFSAAFTHLLSIIDPSPREESTESSTESTFRGTFPGLDVMNKEHFMMFLVDDLVFYRELSLCDIFQEFATCSVPCFGLQLKLHPGIMFSHPANKTNFPPPLFPLPLTSSSSSSSPPPGVRKHSKLLLFEYAAGSVDWRYPLDFCAGIYRVKDIEYMINEIFKDEAVWNTLNPNTLEVALNRIFWSDARIQSRYKHGACLNYDVLSIVTVNQVQTTYTVPIYQSISMDGSVAALNGLMRLRSDCAGAIPCSFDADMASYDLMRYSNDPLRCSAHVGELFFRSDKSPESVASEARSQQEVSTRGISLLIPVYNGSSYILRALNSVFEAHCGDDFAVEVILVDDGSTDPTLTIVREYLNARLHGGQCYPSLTVHVVSIPHCGLPIALDIGLQFCSHDLVARLDADDEIWPGRLIRQMEILRRFDNIHVVGTQAMLATPACECTDTMTPSKASIAAGIYTHPVMVQWAMMFRCCLLHPTVMFRKSIILSVGGYSANISEVRCSMLSKVELKSKSDGCIINSNAYVILSRVAVDIGSNVNDAHCAPWTLWSQEIEDYAIWVRILQRYPLSIINVPAVLTTIHIRAESKSRVSATSKHASTANYELRKFAVDSMLFAPSSVESTGHVYVDLDCLRFLVAPELYLSCNEDLDNALKLLSAMKIRFEQYSLQAINSLSPASGSPDAFTKLAELSSSPMQLPVGLVDESNILMWKSMLQASCQSIRQRLKRAAFTKFNKAKVIDGATASVVASMLGSTALATNISSFL